MRLKTVYDEINALAPFVLSDEFVARGSHDNSGVLVDCGKDIAKVLCTLDLTEEAVKKAIAAGADCIVTHHPAIFYGRTKLTPDDPVLQCIAAGISVVSAHLNLDAAEGGIDACLMEGLGGKSPLAVMEEVSCGAYGRVYDVAPRAMEAFVSAASETFRTSRIVAYGSGEVRRVASFCGAGLDEDSVEFAAKHGADTIVSSDGKHHVLIDAVAKGMKVVLLTHYASENYGFMQFAARLRARLGVAVETFTDTRFL